MATAAGRNIPLPAGRSLDFGRGTLVMGIINCTPDSFYPESRQPGVGNAIVAAQRMIEAGADILDFGGESTRPGAGYVEEGEQILRVIPVIEAVRSGSAIAISVDTRSASVARAALAAGADIVNDVSGLSDDPVMVAVAAEAGCPVVIMHMRGTSETMQRRPHYEDTVAEIKSELAERIEHARDGGVDLSRIIVDPGIGFGKRLEDNLRILKHLSAFREMGYPLLLGVSRKSFIESLLGRSVGERLVGTLAAEAWAVLAEVEILRVHDVAETVDLVRTLQAIRGATP